LVYVFVSLATTFHDQDSAMGYRALLQIAKQLKQNPARREKIKVVFFFSSHSEVFSLRARFVSIVLQFIVVASKD